VTKAKMGYYWIIIIISLLLSAFFSGMEIAFVSSNKLRIELDRKQERFPTRIISVFTRNPGQYIATMLVGNNVALVVYGIMMAAVLIPLIQLYVSSDLAILVIQTIISTGIILLTAEFLPKALFRITPNAFLKVFGIPVLIFYVIFFPITRVSIWLSNFILKNFMHVKTAVSREKSVFGKVDLDNLVHEVQSESDEQKEIENEFKIFQNALDFSKVKIRDCMIPRTEIEAIEVDASIEELRNRFVETGYSKILVFRDNIENILGYVSSKELFRNPDNIKDRIMSVITVPETMPANRLLRSFMQEHKSMAVVVDEFGGTAGIITIEDILEEIIGEIEDEHDVDEYIEKQVNDNEFVFSGRLEIDFLNEKYRLGLPESEEYETIAGLILYHYENIPKINERIVINSHFTFRIIKVTNTRIELVYLTIHND